MNLKELKEDGYSFLSNTDNHYGGGKLVGQFWDGTETVSKVYQFGDEYVQFDGYYTSYDGLDFTECFLVEPETYTAVRYNRKKVVEFTVNRLLNDIEEVFNDDDLEDDPQYAIETLPGVLSCECIEEYDRDDYGADAHRIYKIETVTNQTLFVRVDGSYSSYSGFELNTIKIVEPKQKTITVYE